MLTPMMSASRRKNAFSLIELVIVMTIIGIFAAIVLPSYNESIERTRRTDCNRYLLEVASKQVQFYTQYSSYTDIIEAPENCIATNCGLNLPTDNSEHNTCTVNATVLPNNCGAATDPFVPCTEFILIGNLDKDRRCATVSLDNLGQKQATAGRHNTLTGDNLVDFCWR